MAYSNNIGLQFNYISVGIEPWKRNLLYADFLLFVLGVSDKNVFLIGFWFRSRLRVRLIRLWLFFCDWAGSGRTLNG